MTQFRIDVIVDPRKAVRGTQAVKKGLRDVEKQANKTQDRIRNLFAGLTVIFAVKQLVGLGDAFTNLQNRLRVVTDGQAELTVKTEELLQVANRSRSAFESTAELYSRLALATRELNLEGADLVQITESINKAIILSGASAKEANNGLIQLSQGLASGRLTGDELRSTLEQLPVVADVIAKQMGVTRGELRALGAQGKITSITIIKAFQAAEQELEAAFAETIPTISQSFVVLRNNVIAFIGRINEGTGILRAFGNAIRFVGTELSTIVKTLALIGATAGLIKLAPLIQNFFKLSAAIKAGTAVRLGSVAAINLQNKFLAKQAVANVTAAIAELKRTDAIINNIKIESIANSIRLRGNAIMFEKAVVTRQLTAIEAQRTKQLAALIAAEKAQSAAALTASTNVTLFSRSLGTAKAAIKSFTLFLAANPIGVFVVAIGAIISALFFFRKDIKLTEGGLANLGHFIEAFFRSVKNAFLAITEFFGRVFEPLVDEVKRALGIVEFDFLGILKFIAGVVDSTIGLFLGLGAAIGIALINLPSIVGNIFIKAVNLIIGTIENIPQAFIGILKTLAEVTAIFIDNVSGAFRELAAGFNLAITGDFEGAKSLAEDAKITIANAFTRATDGIGERLFDNVAEEIDKKFLPRIPELEKTLEDAGSAISDAFFAGAGVTPAGDFIEGLALLAEQLALEDAAQAATEAKEQADRQAAIAAAERAEAITKVIKPLAQENLLLRESISLGSREAAIRATLREVTEKLAKEGAKLNFIQTLFVQGLVRRNAAMTEAISTAEGLETAEQTLTKRLREVKNAFDNNKISLEVMNEAQREAELVALEASTSFADGWEAALERNIDLLKDFGNTAEEIMGTLIPGLVDSMGESFGVGFAFLAKTLTDSDASWVEYREAIKATFKGLIDDILAQLAKLLAQKALLALLEAATGGEGGFFKAASKAFGLEGKAHGGIVTANKPFIAGEEGPEIVNPGQTGTVTPNDQTIEALTGGAANKRETMVVQAPAPEVNVTNVIVDDPTAIPAGIESPDGVQAVRNIIRKDRSGIKRDLG